MKFFGDSPVNNCVTVDYDNRKVFFEPIGHRNLFSLYVQFSTPLFLLELCQILIVFGIISIWCGLIPEFLYSQILTIFIQIFVCSLTLLFFILSLHFWIPRWRKEYFPLLNFKISKMFFMEKSLVINPEILHDNKFIIPSFDNIGLEYEASKDFSKFLRRIEVRNIFVGTDEFWQCIFVFRKKPKSGELSIKYV